MTMNRVPRIALVLIAFFVFDLGFAGQGLISLAVAFVGALVVVLRAAWALLRGRYTVAKSRPAHAALFCLLGVATVGALRFHKYTAESNAARIIAACRAYEAKHGTLPDTLQALVPAYLPRVPRAKYVLAWGDFSYWGEPGGAHTLSYIDLPPFGRRLYDFSTKRWIVMD